MFLLTLLACPTPPDTGGYGGGACGDASRELELLVCRHRIDSWEQWDELAVDATPVDEQSSTKWLMPAGPEARLPTLFANSQVWDLHSTMLATAFPEQHPGITQREYSRMVLEDPPVYYSGNISVFLRSDGSTFLGFIVWDDPADASTTQTYQEVLEVWKELDNCTDLGPLTFVPNSRNQEDAAADWDAPFAIAGRDDSIPYEVYSPGEAFGTLRLQPLDELAQAEEDASFGWQDILVFDEAPLDLERIVSGIVTGSRQGELSHLNVRSAARGTPNCYLRAPFDALADWEGQLVRFECGQDDWDVRSATQAEAEAWWEDIRPDPVTVPTPDFQTAEIVGLLQVDTSSASAREAAVAAYGSKGSNLATLYQRIDADLQLNGFLVPMALYGEQMAQGGLQERIEALHVDEGFLSDPAQRRQDLASLRADIRASEVDADTVQALYDAIVAAEGSDTVMVRFRSSSNAEDSLEFSGAGLYDSTSVCAADSFDGDDEGPSLCDPDQPKERSIERGLLKVHASLWKVAAWEERAWYGMDQLEVAMGVLVDTRSKDEQANIVAFTGVPSDPEDERYLVNAQVGWLDVVSAESGVWPERALLELSSSGQVTGIVRVDSSSEADEVLSDARLEELGEALWTVEDVYPSQGSAMLDTEWKVLEDGRLVIKQVRPFTAD
jgi:hypothetical protein